MAENGNNALGNALSAANAVRGAVKTGKAIAAAAKGSTVKPGLAIHGSEVDSAMKMLKEWV